VTISVTLALRRFEAKFYGLGLGFGTYGLGLGLGLEGCIFGINPNLRN